MTITKAPKTKTNVGLNDAATEAISDKLNQYLGNLHVLYTKLHNFHWNIEGGSFYTLHEELQAMYEAVAAEIDEVAERVLKIGRRPLARMADYLEVATLKEIDSNAYTGQEIADHLISDLQVLITQLRETITLAQDHGDEGTADDAIAFLKEREKAVWMLTAYRG
ncbi:MAG: Dps family protein [Spirochaetaceae bacterium]